jgi:electron transport complex protein RnfG
LEDSRLRPGEAGGNEGADGNMQSVKRAGAFRLIATLGLAALTSGLILVTVYVATQPLILRNQAAALESAIYRVVPESNSRKVFVVQQGKLVPVEGNATPAPGSDVVYGAFDANGRLLGFAIPAEGPGFQDNIKLIYGYDPRRKVIVGMEVLDSKETPGLGDKIMKDEHFRSNFTALAVEPEVVPVKPGAKSEPNEVDTISGATISSKAVVTIINQGNRRFLPLIEAAAAETGGGQ